MARVHHYRPDQPISEEMRSDSEPSWLDLFFVGVRRGWRAHGRYERLSRMSDEALRKRGLRRYGIGRHAFFDDDDL